MEKTIKIGNNEIRMRASALIPRLYRNKFGRDVISDMRKLQTSVKKAESGEEQLDIADLTIFENIAWLMCKHADPSVPDDPDEWLDGIDGVFSVYEILPEILELWSQSQQTTSVPRKK